MPLYEGHVEEVDEWGCLSSPLVLFVVFIMAALFCLSRTLSFKDVLEFSTDEREKLDVKKKAFIA